MPFGWGCARSPQEDLEENKAWARFATCTRREIRPCTTSQPSPPYQKGQYMMLHIVSKASPNPQWRSFSEVARGDASYAHFPFLLFDVRSLGQPPRWQCNAGCGQLCYVLALTRSSLRALCALLPPQPPKRAAHRGQRSSSAESLSKKRSPKIILTHTLTHSHTHTHTRTHRRR